MHMPKQQHLNPETKQELAKIMQLKPNKKAITKSLDLFTKKTNNFEKIFMINKITRGCDFRELITEMKKVCTACITELIYSLVGHNILKPVK